jgi:hypothetical protein
MSINRDDWVVHPLNGGRLFLVPPIDFLHMMGAPVDEFTSDTVGHRRSTVN